MKDYVSEIIASTYRVYKITPHAHLQQNKFHHEYQMQVYSYDWSILFEM